MKQPLLLVCLSLSGLFPASAFGQSGDPTLTGRAAIDRIIGNTLIFAPKEPIPDADVKSFIYLSPDGRTALQVTANGQPVLADKAHAHAGRWSIDDQDRLCLVQTGRTLRDRDCKALAVTDDTVRSATNDAFETSDVRIVAGNPNGL